jgi:thiol-disulfide isomerase/thioredoxin
MTVDLKTQLRDYTEFFVSTIDAVEIEEILGPTTETDGTIRENREGRGTMKTLTPTKERKLRPRQPRYSPRPILAFVVGLIVILVVTGGVALWVGGGDPDVAPEPTQTTAAPDSLLDLPMSQVPPFRAEVRLAIDPLATSVVSGGSVEIADALITVSYGGPGLFRVDVTRDIPFFTTSTEEPHDPYPDTPAAAAGSFIVVRDDTAGRFTPNENLFHLIEEPDPLGLFAWESWNDLCTDHGHELLEPEALAGRDTLRLRCANGSDATELWVDAETGLLLRVAGSEQLSLAMPGNYVPKFGYEVLSVEYDPAFADGLFDLTAPPGATVEDARGRDEFVRLEIGRAAPLLTGTSLDGVVFDLEELRGERVAILFWGSWCEPCWDALRDVASVAEVTEDVVFVTVLVEDQPDDARSTLLNLGIQLDTIDPSSTLSGQWADGAPTFVLVEQDGTVAGSHFGYRPVDTVEGFLREAGW